MAYKLRVQRSDKIYLISTRCQGAQHLLRPDPKCCAMILACLCREVQKHDIIMYGYVFMSNHFHLLCSAPKLNLGEFMRDLNSSLAKRLNQHRDRNGSFFGERYTKVDVLCDSKAFEKLIYILMNPCAAGLVATPDEYPGISSYAHHLNGEKVQGHWLDLKRFHRNRKRNPTCREDEYTTTYEFELTPLPSLQQCSHKELAQRFETAIIKRCKKLHKKRKENGKKTYLGAKKCREIDPFSSPRRPKKSSYSPCVGTDCKAVQEYHEQHKEITRAYRKARTLDCKSVREKTVKKVCYPPGTIPPGCMRCVPYDDKEVIGTQSKARL